MLWKLQAVSFYLICSQNRDAFKGKPGYWIKEHLQDKAHISDEVVEGRDGRISKRVWIFPFSAVLPCKSLWWYFMFRIFHLCLAHYLYHCGKDRLIRLFPEEEHKHAFSVLFCTKIRLQKRKTHTALKDFNIGWSFCFNNLFSHLPCHVDLHV